MSSLHIPPQIRKAIDLEKSTAVIRIDNYGLHLFVLCFLEYNKKDFYKLPFPHKKP